ncbi:hypothetical protein BXZ70DRAFT_1007180 [Cristinia sonorae]|uniref:F-box domain-containing protein n=1 Tax=Cristinia sonorae TaxID=1940300 RepID=A0A8K0UQZ1_9AGAR|nr:hypothetical protein BXZ70DRAFT_1007180 [Cristinia sonorae]
MVGSLTQKPFPIPAFHKMVTTIEFPQEITDIIVDLASSDLNCLKSCALISRQWRDRSQYHIHHTLTIGRLTDTELLHEVYRDALVASYVREVTVESMWGRYWTSIAPVLERLHAVRSLSLMSVGTVDPEMQHFITTQFASLDSISLAFAAFDDFPALSAFLNGLPNLSKMAFKNIYWSRSKGELTEKSVHRLRELKIMYCTEQDVLLKWLMGAGDKLQVNTLTMTWYEKADAVRKFVHSLGQHLHHLTVSFSLSDPYSRDWKKHPLDLSSNTGLRTLEFRPNVFLPIVWGSLPTVPEMIATVNSPHLSTLTVHIANLDEDPVPTGSLSSIDDILDRPHFRTLSALQIVAGIHSKFEDGRESCQERTYAMIRSAMPKMFERDLMKVLREEEMKSS